MNDEQEKSENLRDDNSPINEQNQSTDPMQNMDQQAPFEIPEEKVLSEVDPNKEKMLVDEIAPENPSSSNTEIMEVPKDHSESIHQQEPFEIPAEKVLSEIDPNKASDKETDEEEEEDEEDSKHHSEDPRSIEELLSAIEKLINKPEAGENFKEFNSLKNLAQNKIQDEIDEKKEELTEEARPGDDFHFEHPQQAKLSGLISIFKEKHDQHLKKQEEQHAENLEVRQQIIERLKNLYTTSEPGTNLFKEIRAIKEDWSSAGQVPKSEFRILNNNYFHHLNQFYQMLDLNKEYLEQEFSHNLEKRKHIISRAKELLKEPVQMALNELQYLHKLWKEEAEPVAEEFRESTWEEFKQISNEIHDRKAELSESIEKEQQENLEKKNAIIEKIKSISSPEKAPNHNYWQSAINQVEALRTEFLKLGSVPRKLSNQNWNTFKETLRAFNSKKNDFYKGLKGAQVNNLQEKKKLIQIAKDNMNSEDWDTMVPLFKKLQQDWKAIGHVPRSQANEIWDEFKTACNTFFSNYRSKNSAAGDNWRENYKAKKELLEELKAIGDDPESVKKIDEIKSKWNAVGKVPRDKLSINTEFNKALREKLKLNKITEFDLKDENLSESQLTDKARKIKNQIMDLEAETAKLENNLAFFSDSSRNNPLLKDTYVTIDEKKETLEHLRQTLHQIITGEQ